jgi:hypothetical protein
VTDDERSLSEQLEDVILWHTSEAPLAQEMYRHPGEVEGDLAAHVVLMGQQVQGIRAALLRLADEVDALKRLGLEPPE